MSPSEHRTATRSAGASTAPDPISLRHLRRDRWIRRVVMGGLTIFVLLGASGVFGVRTASVSASGGGYRLTVIYPAVARPGLAIKWELRLTRAGGFDGPISLATTLQYFDILDFNNWQSTPTSITNRGDMVVWVFDPPEGDTLVVDVDGRLAPAVQRGTEASTSVMRGEERVVTVHYETRVMP
jgi:hypothetical protein